jgi:hypothetical protein
VRLSLRILLNWTKYSLYLFLNEAVIHVENLLSACFLVGFWPALTDYRGEPCSNGVPNIPSSTIENIPGRCRYCSHAVSLVFMGRLALYHPRLHNGLGDRICTDGISLREYLRSHFCLACLGRFKGILFRATNSMITSTPCYQYLTVENTTIPIYLRAEKRLHSNYDPNTTFNVQPNFELPLLNRSWAFQWGVSLGMSRENLL